MASSFFTVSGFGIGDVVTGLDLNGDGISDLVFGDPVNNRVTVIYGDPDGFAQPLDPANLPTRLGFTIQGAAHAEFGAALAWADDFGGAGVDALLIGARAAGQVHVVFAGQTTVGLTVTGLPPLANGMTLTGLGDLNNDGFGDFATGAPDAQNGAGAVYVIYGSAAAGSTLDVATLTDSTGFVLHSGGDNDLTGAAIAGGFDVTGDGLSDLLIGAPAYDDGITGTDAGTVYVVAGASTPQPSLTPAITGLAAGDRAGGSIAVGPDVNGDGNADFVIAATGNATVAGYVVFGGSLTMPVDLAALNGSNGFAITGSDLSGAAVQMLGDVSGDGLGDIGVITQTGDVYILFGSDNPAASFDLTTLNGTNGFALTGLFAGVPSSVSLTNLGDINADPSGAINDLAISARYNDGTPASSIVILGGIANFAALDGNGDGQINFANLTAPDFVPTDTTIVIGGDGQANLDEDATSVSGGISITDSTSAPQPSFRDATATGAFGVFLVNNTGDLWTYTRTTDMNYLDAGDVAIDSAILTADNGAKRKITINIQGMDDPATLDPSSDTTISITKNDALTSGKTIRLIDLDDDDNPVFTNGTKGVGTYGEITVLDDAGGYTYRLTDPTLQALDSGNQAIDDITLIASDGSSHVISVTIVGVNDSTPLIFSGGGAINTSYGNDVVTVTDNENYTINTGAGDDEITLGDGQNVVFVALGNNSVTTGNGANTITLLTGNNSITTGAGNDTIIAGYGDDTIYAGAGNDVIAADTGSVFAFGNNRITGGQGDDLMMGGAGVDTFVFRPDDGNDTIARFDPTDAAPAPLGRSFQTGIDKIALEEFASVTAGNVMDFVTQADNGYQFDAEGTTILFYNAFILSSSDFII